MEQHNFLIRHLPLDLRGDTGIFFAMTERPVGMLRAPGVMARE